MRKNTKPSARKSATVASKRPWTAPPPHEIYSVRDEELAKSFNTAFGIPETFAFGSDKGATLLRDGVMAALQGDKAAVTEAIHLLSFYIDVLNNAIAANLEELGEIGQGFSLWPVTSGLSPKITSKHAAFFHSIGLGSKVSPTANAKAVGIVKTDAKRAAVALIDLIGSIRLSNTLASCYERDRSPLVFRAALASTYTNDFFSEARYTDRTVADSIALAPLCDDPDVIARWWEVGRELLMLSTSGKPERVPALYEIGKYNKAHGSAVVVPKNSRDSEDLPSDAVSEGGSASNVRAAIIKRLQKEFKSIAVNIPTLAKEKSAEEG